MFPRKPHPGKIKVRGKTLSIQCMEFMSLARRVGQKAIDRVDWSYSETRDRGMATMTFRNFWASGYLTLFA